MWLLGLQLKAGPHVMMVNYKQHWLVLYTLYRVCLWLQVKHVKVCFCIKGIQSVGLLKTLNLSLFNIWQRCSFRPQFDFSGTHWPCYNYWLNTVHSHNIISTTVYSQVFIYTGECTGAPRIEGKRTSFETAAKQIKTRLPRLRVRRSTSELPRSTHVWSPGNCMFDLCWSSTQSVAVGLKIWWWHPYKWLSLSLCSDGSMLSCCEVDDSAPQIPPLCHSGCFTNVCPRPFLYVFLY